MTSFFNSDIEPSVVLIGINNNKPSNYWIPETIETRAMFYLIYISFWIFILYGLKTHIVGHPASIKFGFSIGFALLLAFDYLYNYANQLMIDSNNKKFTEMNILSTNIVLDDKMFKLNKTQGLVIKNSIFERFKKEKKLNTIDIQSYRDSEYFKTTGIIGSDNTPLASYALSNRLLLSGSYMFITVITACIIASHHNKELLASMLPFATTSGILAVAFISLWFVDRNYTSLINTQKIKSKIFIMAFSFAFTTIVTPFFFI